MKKDNITNADKQFHDNISDAFAKVTEKNEIAEVLKELFDKNKIYMITDLSKDEIKLATRIYMIAKMKKIKIWHEGLEFFATMVLSMNRKSRKELLDAIRGYNAQLGMFGKLNPANWGRNH